MELPDQGLMVARLLLAAVLGALIGVEREYRGYPAGVRTIALVCVGSALFTEVSPLFNGDAGRVPAQIVTGIGFLCAGVIVREGLSVHGITTAAMIWTAAAVGVAVAAHLFVVAVFAALLVVVLLEASPLTKLLAERGARMRSEQGAPGVVGTE
jgi:putative Mg2+ transporter-C (MgtC) family protein